MDAKKAGLFDVRTLDHKVRRGEVTRAQVRTHLDALPDEAAQGEESKVRFSNPFEQRQAERLAETDED
jgi:hypothetical protein